MDDHRSHAVIRTPGNLIATLPALLGYRPYDALIVAAFRQDLNIAVMSMGLTAPADQPAPQPLPAVRQIGTVCLRHSADSAHAVLVGPAAHPDQPHVPPLLRQLRAELRPHLHLVHVLWTPAVEHGARWHCLEEATCRGTVPDPMATVAAASEVAAGRPIYRSRAELTATLEPDRPDALARRADLIRTALHAAAHQDQATRLARHNKLLTDAVTHARRGQLPHDDTQIAELAAALADHAVRDAAIAFSIHADADAAIQLWSVLTRQVPAPYRAEPASLLAVAAHLAGQGALSNTAVEVALTAVPGHTLATFLGAATSLGMAPNDLREAITAALAQISRITRP
jgi:hypothetical protein